MPIHPFGLTRENKIFLTLLALIGAGMIVVSTNRHGVVVWPDSIIYISTARKVLAGAGFVIFDGEPLALWPPLYPALLAAVARIFGTDPLIVAPFINAIVFGMIVYLSGAMMFRYLSSIPILAVMGSLAVLFSIPLVSISVVAYSEPLFIIFMVLSFIFIGTYLTDHERLPLVLLSISVSLACLAQYLGITLIVWGGLIILFFNRNGLKNKVADLIVFTVITVLPLGGWLTRNYFLTHTLSGPCIPPVFSLVQILVYGYNNILEWYLPGVITGCAILLTLVIAAIAFVVGYSLRARWQWLKVNLKQLDPTLMFIISCLLFMVIYSGFLIVTALNSYVSLFETRKWAPIFIPLTFLILVSIREFVGQIRKRLSGEKNEIDLVRRYRNLADLSGLRHGCQYGLSHQGRRRDWRSGLDRERNNSLPARGPV